MLFIKHLRPVSVLGVLTLLSVFSVIGPTPRVTAIQAATESAPAPIPLPINVEDFKKQSDAFISSFMADNEVSACSFALVYPDPATSELQTYILAKGTLSKQSKKPVGPTTMY